MMYTVIAETFEAVEMTGTVMSAYCDATKNQTKLKVKHENGKVASLTIPTASKKRLDCLKAGMEVKYVCGHEAIIEKNGCRFFAENAATIEFLCR